MKDKKQGLLTLGFVVLLILIANVAGRFAFKRIDFTEDQRYTLKSATIRLLKQVEEPIYFKVYLDGDLPPGMSRLRQNTREMLDEFAAYNHKIRYEFVDVYGIADEKIRQTMLDELAKKGMQPINLEVKEKGGMLRKMVFPSAEAVSGGRHEVVELLQNKVFGSSDATLQASIQGLEYQLAAAVYKLHLKKRKTVAFLDGHGELDIPHSIQAAYALAGFYNVDRVYLNDSPERLLAVDSNGQVIPSFDALIIPKPTKPFSDIDRWTIDQYIMRGGKVLWMIDVTDASMDTLRNTGVQVALPLDLRLSDMLFTYGVRINSHLLLDLQAAPVPLVTGMIGNQPQTEFFPFPYLPLILPLNDQPIVKNLNALKTEFVSDIDTIESPAAKTVLLTTSRYSRKVALPQVIDFEMLKEKLDPRAFRQGPQPVAVLLEGPFESAFKYKMAYGLENIRIPFQQKIAHSKMIVVADGDMIKNQVNQTQNYPYPLGFDPYTQEMYGNKDFIVNSMLYLTEGTDLLGLRTKEVKMRLMDKTKIAQERLDWQLLNVVAPIVLVLVAGVIWSAYRRYKCTTNKIWKSL